MIGVFVNKKEKVFNYIQKKMGKEEMIKCACCDKKAEYVLVNYRHEIIGKENVYCSLHAFDDSREKCPCCYDYEIDVYNAVTESDVALLPTYSQGTLDNEGCCSEHP